MADEKISALTDGSPAQTTDDLVVARGGANYKLPVADVLSALSGRGFVSGLYYMPLGVSDNWGNDSYSVGSLHCVPFLVNKPTAFNQLAAQVATAGAGSAVRLGIYADNGNTYPGSLIVDAGTIDASTTGTKTLAIAETLDVGLYWLGAVAQGASCNLVDSGTGSWLIGSVSIPFASARSQGSYVQSSVTGALPASFTATVTTDLLAPIIYVKAA